MIYQKRKKIIIVDPKKNNFSLYKGSTYITPNFKELLEASKNEKNISKNNDDKLVIKLAKSLLKNLQFEAIIVTRSSKGISIVGNKNRYLHLPSKAKEVYDVSGAGDTVIAYIASGLANGKSLFNATEIANDAAGIAVGKFGTSIVNENDLLDSSQFKKLCTLEEVFFEIKKKG